MMNERVSIGMGAKKENLTEKAYDIIKASIRDGSIASGVILSESDLGRKLDMSRTPIREALRQLEKEGVVEIRTGVGALVLEPSNKQISDIFEARKAIELLAARKAIKYFPQSKIDELKEKLIALVDDFENGKENEVDYLELDLIFHSTLVENCGNEYLAKIMEPILFDVRRTLLMRCGLESSIEESAKQHLDLLALLEKRDEEEFVNALSTHLDWSIDWFGNDYKK